MVPGFSAAYPVDLPEKGTRQNQAANIPILSQSGSLKVQPSPAASGLRPRLSNSVFAFAWS